MPKWLQKQGHWTVGVIVGLLLILGPMSLAAAQDAEPFGGLTAIAQAAPSGEDAQSTARSSIFPFLLYGGAFQLIDNSGGACTGQCVFINPQTGTCSCPSGFRADAAARILTDAAGGGFPCGSVLYICGK